MAEEQEKLAKHGDMLRMAVEIVSAYVSNNSVPAAQVPEVINTVFKSLATIFGRAPYRKSGCMRMPQVVKAHLRKIGVRDKIPEGPGDRTRAPVWLAKIPSAGF